MASREVSGTDELLSHLIDSGEIEQPELMTFNQWQTWRAGPGRRPNKRVDGASSLQATESALWRATMAANHGDDWITDIAAREAAPDASEDEEEEHPAEPLEPALQARPAGEVLHPGSAAARASSPGSGVVTPPRREGSRTMPGTPNSWRSNEPGTPGGLTRMVHRMFDPEKESLQVHENRLRRQALALETIGVPMPASALDVLLIKARIISEAPTGTSDRLKLFKREFAIGLLDDDPANAEDNAVRLKAFEELLTEHGFDPKDVRMRILQGEPVATPSPKKQMLSAANGLGRMPEFPIQVMPAGFAGPHAGIFPESGGRTPLASPEVDALRARLEASEIKIASMAVQQQTAAGSSDLATLMEAQTKALVEGLGQTGKRSTIRVEPRVTWPKLGDDGSGGREVEEFYEKLEEIYGLANNGKGMSPKEMLVALKSCLTGSRKKIYENMMKKQGSGALSDATAQEVYDEVRDRLMRFTEKLMERQLRLRREWEALSKGKHMTALQFEAAWKSCLQA